MGLFGGMVEGYNKVKGRKDQNFNDQFERAKSMVAMQEAGYSFDPKTNTLSRSDQFGQVPAGFVRVGGKAVQDPTYVNQKDQLDIEEKNGRKNSVINLGLVLLLAHRPLGKEFLQRPMVSLPHLEEALVIIGTTQLTINLRKLLISN